MSANTPNPPVEKPKAEMTAAQAAKLVKRPVLAPAKNPGEEPKLELVSVAAAEVLAFRDYGTHVVVVTKDGKKFSSADTKAEAAEAA
jgi:hypothetical protein